ncbi:nuclease (SNase-like) [Jannaschia sp. CCS1]|nr:nuclease (SNase-like) [Jannaschia sp. CCS1]
MMKRDKDAPGNPPLDQSWQKQTKRPSPPAPSARPAPYNAGHVTSRKLRGRAWVIDGDTIAIDRSKIRLAGIDAPELDEPWGQKSKWAMVRLCKGQIITAHLTGETSYDRVVGTCYLDDGRDLAAELIKAGLALDFAHFSGGKYRHLETTDLRRKLSAVRRKMQATKVLD